MVMLQGMGPANLCRIWMFSILQSSTPPSEPSPAGLPVGEGQGRERWSHFVSIPRTPPIFGQGSFVPLQSPARLPVKGGQGREPVSHFRYQCKKLLQFWGVPLRSPAKLRVKGGQGREPVSPFSCRYQGGILAASGGGPIHHCHPPKDC